MPGDLENQFHHAMVGVYEYAKKYDYFATYFKRMVDEYGGIGAAKRLLVKEEIQDGLMKLWELHALDQTVEALVLQERFRPLFSDSEIFEAHRRLEELGYFKTKS